MIFRYARHTTDLQRIEEFYTKVVGLQKIGNFQNHNNYDGLFLGLPCMNWHLEFTRSNEIPQSMFDEDDALVFYFTSENEILKVKERIEENNIKLEIPRNPYWHEHGIIISDPDGYKVIFSLSGFTITEKAAQSLQPL